MSGRKLFGTDGIRAVAGEYPLDAKTIYATGLALGHSLSKVANAGVLIGRDTRESGMQIASTLACALRSTGVRVFSAGVSRRHAMLVRIRRMRIHLAQRAVRNPWLAKITAT